MGKFRHNKSGLRGRAEGEDQATSPSTERPDSLLLQEKNKMSGRTVTSKLVCDGCRNDSDFEAERTSNETLLYCRRCGLEVSRRPSILGIDDMKYGRGPQHDAVIDKNLGMSRSRAVRNPILKLALNEAKKNPGSYIAPGDFKAHQQAYWKLLQWDKPADDRYTREALEILRAKLFSLQHNGRKLPESEVVRIALSVRKCVKKRTSLQRRELQDIVDTVLKINGLVVV